MHFMHSKRAKKQENKKLHPYLVATAQVAHTKPYKGNGPACFAVSMKSGEQVMHPKNCLVNFGMS